MSINNYDLGRDVINTEILISIKASLGELKKCFPIEFQKALEALDNTQDQLNDSL